MQSGEWKVQIGGSRVQTWYRHYLGARIRQWQTGKGYLWFSSRDKMTKRQTLIQVFFYIHAFHWAFYSHKDPKSSLHKIIVSWLSEGSHDFVALSRALLWDEFVWKMSAQLRGLRKGHTWYLSILVHHCITTAPPPVVAVLTNISNGRIQCLLKYKVNTYSCACIVK